MARPPFSKKGSCRWLLFQSQCLKEDLCLHCKDLERLGDRTLRRYAKEGKVNMAACERFSKAEHQQSEAMLPPRAARKRRYTMPSRSKVEYDSPLVMKRKKSRLSRAFGGFVEINKRLREGKATKPGVEREVLRTLAGNEKISLPADGKGRTTQSKAKKTAADLVDGAAMLVANCQTQEVTRKAHTAHSYRDKMVAAAYQRKTTLEVQREVQGPLTEAEHKNQEYARSIGARDEINKMNETSRSVLQTMGEQLKNEFKTPAERRPQLAVFAQANVSKPATERLTGITISDKEWHKIRIHSRFPGSMKQAAKPKCFRQRIGTQYLLSLLHYLDEPGNLQRFAFGTKLLQLAGGSDGSQTLRLDRVDRLKKALDLAVEFILAIEADLNDESDLPPEDQRCCCLEKLTKRRCRKKRQHDGKHKYTGKSSLSVTTVKDMVKTLTGDDLKRLCGLDDTKVLKGRENFQRLRRITNEIDTNPTTRAKMIERIDVIEVYYMTDFQNHLEKTGKNKCNCLTCGFCDEKTGWGISCPSRKDHQNSCSKCTESFAIIADLESMLATVKSNQQERENATALELQKLEETEADLWRAKTDLHEYRSHLARHKAEGMYDAEELEDLADDSVVVISDYKMKILACFFRENQQRWFGKRGTSCLGFMIISNSKDPDVRAKGIKEMKFVMMLSDDTFQDEWEVACAKQEIYLNHIPDDIGKVHFHTDGAANFRSTLHKLVQPMWKTWTKGAVEEVVLRVTPAGGGKSALDGMFGRMNVCLGSAVDGGASYFDAQTTCEALETSGGLAATEFIRFQPDRSSRLYGVFENGIQANSILRSELNEQDRSVTLFKHSGYGCGLRIYPSQFVLSHKRKPEAKDINQNSRDLLITRQCGGLADLVKEVFRVEGELPSVPKRSKQEQSACVAIVRSALEAMYFWDVMSPTLACHTPTCSEVVSYNNKKQEVRSFKAPKGQGASHPDMRAARRGTRMETKTKQDQDSVGFVRSQKLVAGIFLCTERCPETLHYCRCEYLTQKGLDNHLGSCKHDFPLGISSSDKAVKLAAGPGGLMNVGGRTNRKDTSLKAFPPAPNNVASAEADCFCKFNRKEGTKAYEKPEMLKLALEEIFDMEQNGAKLNPEQAWEELRKRRDPLDNGLMFCWSKRGVQMARTGKHKKKYEAWSGCSACAYKNKAKDYVGEDKGKETCKPCRCNGMLPTIEMITGFFSTLHKKRKTEGRAKDIEKARYQKELIEARRVEQLQEQGSNQ